MGQQHNFPCRHCQSNYQSTFSGELALHFGGLESINKPIVWVFTDISVCLECGDAQFTVPEKQVKVLRTGASVSRAVH